MKTEDYISVSDAKARLLEVLRGIENGRSRVIITRNGAPKAVLIGYEEFEGLLETIDVLSDSRTVEGVKRGLKDIKAGKTVRLREALSE